MGEFTMGKLTDQELETHFYESCRHDKKEVTEIDFDAAVVHFRQRLQQLLPIFCDTPEEAAEAWNQAISDIRSRLHEYDYSQMLFSWIMRNLTNYLHEHYHQPNPEQASSESGELSASS